MKGKRLIYVILILMILLLGSSCSKTNNEIYNTTYEGSISLNDFEDAVTSVVKSSRDSVIGLNNYIQTFGGIELSSLGSAVVYEGCAVLEDESTCSLEESINRVDVVAYVYRAISNEHVVSDAYVLRAYYKNEEFKATVLLSDEYLDLAIVEFECTYYIPLVKMGDSELLQAGNFVLAIGCPEGMEYYGSATFGIISYAKRYIEEIIGIKKVNNEYIQHDASINSGNSGGALINMKGELIGINTWKIVGEGAEGMGFAIPVNVVKEFIKTYVEEK